ncbi:class I SAM-dependent methyltransferase [Gallaecimonas xiamenensis]|uniref:Ribosomal RNA small subunit methyltransferase J n=1 Tax=Gallaecimonas xiamenensis 3-C-1 TaxID=745411 RepID=K2KJB5_9GAMM|nr:class I SAM-dependent methyltransferase [Gallaecimonas xiamenensis]EKE77405.1 SAM-dependent methyltransferase [Gallaecimonas xiamenensis 3-C-1]
MAVPLICESPEREPHAEQLRQRYGFGRDLGDAPCVLVLTEARLELRKTDEPKLGAIFVDFVEGAAAHRRKFGGGRGQAIAKAVGLKKGANPSVIDGTAGLGRDAFVLATLGCTVTLVERHPAVAALLADGLERAKDSEVADIIGRMTLHHGPSVELLPALQADVVYLDPMYPHREKSALVKKEMRIFQTLVGADLDADALLAAAKAAAKYKVVVKRPDYAEPLAGVKPASSVPTKKNRFDIYPI